VLSPVNPRNWFETWPKRFACACLAILAILPLALPCLSAQDLPVVIGRIEGDDLVVKTATHGEVEINAGPTVVASGSDVTLRSGHALLVFDTGGKISICGPAHFTLLKSAGAVTLALDYGRIHPSLDSPETLTIYTPMIVATPIAISGARRDTTLGLDQNGAMCIFTAHGAMRVEPQFSGQSLLVPQGGVVSLVGGQIESLQGNAPSCSCDFPRPGDELPRPSVSPQITALSRPPQREQKKPDAGSPPPPVQEPVYTVLMPPLTFNASSPEPPPAPSPETILLLREVRVRPSIAFYGHVNPAPEQATSLPQPVSPPPTPATPTKHDVAVPPKPGILTRIWNFFRKLNGQSPCVGAGCGK
jgi:hypothetical protein